MPTGLLVEKLNPLTGEVQSTQSHSFTVIDSFMLPQLHDEQGNRIVILIDNMKRIQIEPRSAVADDLFANISQSIFFHFVDLPSSKIEGYTTGEKVN